MVFLRVLKVVFLRVLKVVVFSEFLDFPVPKRLANPMEQ